MALSIGDVVVQFKSDISDFKSGVSDAKREVLGFRDDVTGSLSEVAGTMKGFGKKATAFATLPILAVGAGAIKAASDVEEMVGKFNTVFQDQSDDVKDWANNFASSVGRSKFQLMGFAATLQDTFVPLGFTREEGAKLSKQLTELTVDMASFNNATEPEVLAALQSAIVGNHETMRQYGVIITETTLNQELLNMGISGGIRQATEAQKVQARLNIIMKKTTDAHGDAARTADSLANQIRALNAQVETFSVEIGQELLPVTKDLLSAIRSLIDWFKGLSDRQRQAITWFLAIVGVVGPVLVILGTLISTIGTVISVLGTVGSVIATVGGVIGAVASGPILLVVAGIAALVAAGYFLVKNWESVRDSLGNILNWIVDKFNNALGVITGAINRIQGATSSIGNAASRVRNAIPGFQHGGTFTVPGVSGIDNQLVQFMASPGETVSITPKGQSGQGGITIHQENVHVRDNTDIQAIAQELGFRANLDPRFRGGL